MQILREILLSLSSSSGKTAKMPWTRESTGARGALTQQQFTSHRSEDQDQGASRSADWCPVKASISLFLPWGWGEGALVSFLIKTPILWWGRHPRDLPEPNYLLKASPANTLSLVPCGHIRAGSKTKSSPSTCAERGSRQCSWGNDGTLFFRDAGDNSFPWL